MATLRNQLTKIRKWLNGNDDKPGKTGKPRKSNITDNDSAKMKPSKGVIQGYDGVTAVDANTRSLSMQRHSARGRSMICWNR